eukprot:4648627-Heterocapsa_arctica.AAC.1
MLTNGTALMLAASMGHRNTTEALVDLGAELEARDDAGWTALMHAAFCGQDATAEALVHGGARIEAQ